MRTPATRWVYATADKKRQEVFSTAGDGESFGGARESVYEAWYRYLAKYYTGKESGEINGIDAVRTAILANPYFVCDHPEIIRKTLDKCPNLFMSLGRRKRPVIDHLDANLILGWASEHYPMLLGGAIPPLCMMNDKAIAFVLRIEAQSESITAGQVRQWIRRWGLKRPPASFVFVKDLRWADGHLQLRV